MQVETFVVEMFSTTNIKRIFDELDKMVAMLQANTIHSITDTCYQVGDLQVFVRVVVYS